MKWVKYFYEPNKQLILALILVVVSQSLQAGDKIYVWPIFEGELLSDGSALTIKNCETGLIASHEICFDFFSSRFVPMQLYEGHLSYYGTHLITTTCTGKLAGMDFCINY